jgi:hypothetical protein
MRRFILSDFTIFVLTLHGKTDDFQSKSFFTLKSYSHAYDTLPNKYNTHIYFPRSVVELCDKKMWMR